MKNLKFLFVVVVSFSLFFACKNNKKHEPDMTKQSSKIGYAIGYNFAKNLKNLKVNISKDAVIKGLKDGLYNDKGYFTQKEIEEILKDFQDQLIKQNIEKFKKDFEQNKIEEEKFLFENAKKKKVITTKSGLQYEILRKGTGEKPTLNDIVIVHYKGMFINGKIFDSSYKRGEPVKFKLSRVIPGWQEGLQLMRVGAKYKFYIPSKLAYGERGAAGVIGPNKLLIFEVELLGIEKRDRKKGIKE